MTETNTAAERGAMADDTARGEGWRPEPRPPWVARLNRAGALLGPPEQIVPLDEQSLVAAATTATGLDDFGPDEWREPFRLLLADLAERAELNLVGRILARYDIVHSLIVRLQMAEAEHRHPDIVEQPIEAPVLITGMGRTGTSILYELMGEDPRWRIPTGWELRYPVPPTEPADGLGESAAEAARSEIDLWYDVVPELRGIHETTADGAEEDVVALAHEFTAASWSAFHRVPNFEAWSALNAAPQSYRFHRRIFQHLQYRNPGRWLWKGPSHLGTLQHFFAEYPDARVIMTHRDPIPVLASSANLIATLRWQRSDVVNYTEHAQAIAFGLPILFEMVTDQRSSGTLPGNRFTDVRFADLMDDHIATIGRIYDDLGLELTADAEQRMRDYLAAKPKGRHGGRGYGFADLGLDVAQTRKQFAAYTERFDVPEEDGHDD